MNFDIALSTTRNLSSYNKSAINILIASFDVFLFHKTFLHYFKIVRRRIFLVWSINCIFDLL